MNGLRGISNGKEPWLVRWILDGTCHQMQDWLHCTVAVPYQWQNFHLWMIMLPITSTLCTMLPSGICTAYVSLHVILQYNYIQTTQLLPYNSILLQSIHLYRLGRNKTPTITCHTKAALFIKLIQHFLSTSVSMPPSQKLIISSQQEVLFLAQMIVVCLLFSHIITTGQPWLPHCAGFSGYSLCCYNTL